MHWCLLIVMQLYTDAYNGGVCQCINDSISAQYSAYRIVATLLPSTASTRAYCITTLLCSAKLTNILV
jgi:hypothetical protein